MDPFWPRPAPKSKEKALPLTIRKLTALALATLPEGDHPDPHCPGLIFRVQKRRRTWVFRTRRAGKRLRDRLGYFPQMGLKEARLAAGEAALRAESGLRAVPEAIVHPRAAGETLGDLLDDYERMRIRENHKLKTFHRRMRDLRRGLGPYLQLGAKAFAKADLREAHTAVVEGRAIGRKHGRKGGPVAGNRFLDVANTFFDWALKEDRVDANHVAAIRMAPEKPRDRTLSHAEIRAVWKASQEMGAYGRLVRFLLIVAAREGEALEMHHGDLLDGLWRKRQVVGANKSGKPKKTILPAMALAEVGTGDARDRVFPGRRGGRFGNLSTCKKRLDAKAGIPHWTLHDLRRTASSGMQELKVEPHVIRYGVLDHTAKGLDAVYLLGDLTVPAGEALQRWATELERIVGTRVIL